MAKEEISLGINCIFSYLFILKGEKHLHKRVYVFHFFFPFLWCRKRPKRNFPRLVSKKYGTETEVTSVLSLDPGG